MMRLAAVLLALAASAAAQSTSAHSGWNLADSLETATDVVVADIVSGNGVDDGAQVTVRATLRVVRTLAGAMAAGAEIPLTWKYKPMLGQGPAATSKVPLERGLWFLRKGVPLQASSGFELGGYYLPAGAAPRYYPADAPLPNKVACELAPLIEEIAARHAADLVVRNPMPIPKPGAPETRNRLRFYSLHMAFDSLEPKATREIYAEFSARPEPYLKAIGLSGRLRHGDASALLDLEADPSLLTVIQNASIALFAFGMDLRDNLPAARALARLAVGETAVAPLESNAPMQLAFTRNPEFLPYLMVMLGSPSTATRGTTLMAFCPLLRASAFWKAEMAEHCPQRAGSSPEPSEPADIAFWRAWWEANRERIAKAIPLPNVHPPARYSIPENTVPVEVPPEIRFQSLLHMTRPVADHYHAADGSMVAGEPPGRHDPIASQLGETDRAAWLEITAAANAKLDANDRRSEQMMNAARLAGTMPEPPQMKALWDERVAILKAALDDLRKRLSPAGWQALEKFFGGMSISGARLAAPAR